MHDPHENPASAAPRKPLVSRLSGRTLPLIVIGLTGGIASGKSTAAKYLAERGAVVVDADRLGHRAYEPDRPGFAKVVAAFGEDVVGADGGIDRKALGAKVFGDPAQLKRLTDIVWPEILALAKEEIAAARESGAKVAVLEAAVLIEAGWQREVDEVWAITVEPEIAVARATARDGLPVAAVQARIDAQLSNAERTAHASTVLDNSSSEAELVAQLDLDWQRLQRASR